MKKRILSIFLTLALAACLLPAAALADNVITDVSIAGLERPELGAAPDAEFEVSGTEGTELSKDYSVEWTDLSTGEAMGDGDTYAPSRDYEATIKLRPAEGYSFPGTANELSVTVEEPGYKVGISAISSAEATIKVTYHVLNRGYGADEGVSVSSEKPHTIAGGEKVFYEDFNSGSEGVTVSEAKWYMDDAEDALAEDAVFGAGHSYTLCLTLTADDYTLFSEELAAVYTLDGEEYTGIIKVSEDGRTADADFIFTDLKGQIRDYRIEGIRVPVVGEEPQTSGFSTAAGSGYEAGYVRWAGEFDGNKFKAGEHYTLTLSLAAKDGYTLELSDKEAVSVNAGTVENLGNDSDTKQPAVDIGFDVIAEPVTISFDAGEGEGSMEALVVGKGDKVKLPENGFTAPEGKEFDKWDKGNAGDEIEAVEDTTVTALWKDAPKANPFNDVKESDYFHDAVLWAFYHEPQITTGMTGTEFRPDSTVTRGQAVTFLWRAMGKPEPGDKENTFKDVSESDYFHDAVLWALEQGITKGVSADEFAPDMPLSTAHMGTFLYRAVKGGGVDGWYQEATDWVLELGLMNGINTMIAENVSCPRANAVTFLYRALK